MTKLSELDAIELLTDVALSTPYKDLQEQYPAATLYMMRQAVLSIYRRQMFNYLRENCGNNPAQKPLAVYYDQYMFSDRVEFGIVWDDGVIMEKPFVYSYATQFPPKDKETPLTKEALLDWAQNCIYERIDWKK